MLWHCDDVEVKGSCQDLVDAIVGVMLLSPLVAAFWRGTWGLIDSFLLGHAHHLSAWLSVALGWLPQLLAVFFHPFLSIFAPPSRPALYAVTSRVYTYVMAVTSVHSWRGPWLVLDDLTGVTLFNASVSFLAGITSLVLLRSFRTVLSAPTGYMLDYETAATYEVTTRFRSEPSSPWHGWDGLVTVVGVGSGVMLTWRGGWMLTDFAFSPLAPLPSAVLTLALGALLAVLLCLAASPQRMAEVTSCDVSTRLPVEVGLTLLGWLAAVLYWRGFWRLLDIFLLPQRAVSGIVTLKSGVKDVVGDSGALRPVAAVGAAADLGNLTLGEYNVTRVLGDVIGGSESVSSTEINIALGLLHALGWFGLRFARASNSLVWRGVTLDAQPGITLTFSPCYVAYLRARARAEVEDDLGTKV